MKWGFIGYGLIAVKFMESLRAVESETPYAIASRSNADSLRTQFPDLKIYNDYNDLYRDEEVDIIYISTTHNFHKQNTIDALAAGKHVVCEKPLGLTVLEVDEMVQSAQSANRFLMEAVWARFLPAYRKACEVVKSGEIGELSLIRSEFAFYDVRQKKRLYDPALAGGSNYDVNIYNLSLILDFYGGEIPEIKVQSRLSDTGTDLSCSSILKYTDGRMAQVYSSIEMTGTNEAWLYGTKGRLKLDGHWKCERFEVHTEEGIEEVELPFDNNGYSHEIEEVAACIEAGKLESQIMSHQDSRNLAALLEKTENLLKVNS